MTQQHTYEVRWYHLLLFAFVVATPWLLTAWTISRFDPSQREAVLHARVAALDSTRVLDSLRIERLNVEGLLWRDRTEEACRMLPLSNFETCRETIDTRLKRRAQRRATRS